MEGGKRTYPQAIGGENQPCALPQPVSISDINEGEEKGGREGGREASKRTRRLLAARINLVPCPSQSLLAMYQLRSSSRSAPGTKSSWRREGEREGGKEDV